MREADNQYDADGGKMLFGKVLEIELPDSPAALQPIPHGRINDLVNYPDFPDNSLIKISLYPFNYIVKTPSCAIFCL